jgi:2-polyprenyl-6-hydroxyphenyl methylase/3-demethylubiquinone-9 3-methyltransferase
MGIGPIVRGMLGRYERPVSDAYRAAFFDIDAAVARMRAWQPSAHRILEVGCGEGVITERLRSAYAEAEITAIDITPRVGRMYAGPPNGLRFLQCDVRSIAAREPGRYDLVVLCDVLHHVPINLRHAVLAAIRVAMAPGGSFVLKEWESRRTVMNAICWATDRWITGDRISYMTREDMRQRLASAFGSSAAIVDEARGPPWFNNLMTLVRA